MENLKCTRNTTPGLAAELVFTQHALKRMRQRNYSYEDVLFVYNYGLTCVCAGVTVYFLGKRQIPSHDYREYARLEGTVVLCCSITGVVKTVYRNKRDGFKSNSRKQKYTRKSNIIWLED